MLEPNYGRPVKGNISLRLAAVSGITAPVLWAILAVVGGLLRPGYNPLTQAVSELGEAGAPLGSALAQRGVVGSFGLLTIVLAVALHGSIGAGRGSKAGPSLVATFGVFITLQALFFPCDPGCVNTSFTGEMHGWTGLAAFLALMLGMLAISQRMKKDGRWKSYRLYSVATVVVYVGLYIGFVLGYEVVSGLGVQGVMQRIVLGVPILWVEVVAIRLLRLSNVSTVSM